MHCTTILAAAIFCTAVSSQEYAGPSQCGCLEVPATGRRHKDQFCRPHLTIPSERHKQRSCVCRPGLVRNAWGDCITKKECTSCKCFRDRDFNVCGRECPAVCNEPISRSCSKSCAFGCDCRPGFVRSSRHRGRCVKAEKCALSCPPFSRFEFCRSTCAPKCGRRPRKTCVTRCTRGDCVCNHGYAEVKHNGETICVPQDQCFRYLQLVPSITPGGNGSLGGGISSGGSVFIPGAPSIPVHPGVVSGGATGSPLPGSVGITGNIGGGVSSGGSVSILATPSIPVHPGVVTGGAVGPSVPGSVGTGGASPIPSVPTVGTGGVVTTVGGGNQPGSLGTGGAPAVPVVTGGVSVGTPSHGVVVARPPGSTNAQGRPSIGTTGFGSAGGGIFTSTVGPNDSMESGESTGVDASGIPQFQGGNRPGSGPAAGGTTTLNEPNGYSGTGVVGSGLLPGVIPPGRIGNPGWPKVGIGAGSPGHGGVGSSFPATPGINREGTRPSGTVVLRPGGFSVGTVGIPTQNHSASGILANGVIANPMTPSNVVSTVSSGTTLSSVASPAGRVSVSNVPSAASTGAGTVSHGVTGNVGHAPAIPSTSTGTATGSTLLHLGTDTVGRTSFGNNVLGSIGNGLVNAPALAAPGPSGATVAVPTGSPSLIGVTGISPQSSGISSAGVSSHVSAGASTTVPNSVTGTGGSTSSIPIPGAAATGFVPVPSSGVGTVSSPSVATSSVTTAGGVNGRIGFGLNTGSGASVATQPGILTSPGSSSTATAGTAAAIGGVLGGLAAIPTTIAAVRALEGVGINSAGLNNATRCGPQGCLNARHSSTNRCVGCT